MTAITARGKQPFLVSAILALALFIAGGLLTDPGVWYRTLHKPVWQPPGWLFGPVWTAIFALTAIAAALAWRATPDKTNRIWLVGLFAMNGLLNVGWSALFFHLQRPDWALIEIGPLWISIVFIVIASGRREKKAAALLLPYLAWVSFASVLNFAIVQMNAAPA